MEGYYELHDDSAVRSPRDGLVSPTPSKARTVATSAMLVAAVVVGAMALSSSSYNSSVATSPSQTIATMALQSTDKCPVVQTNVDFLGNDIGNVLGSGAADCCTKCSQRVGCGAFTWSNYNGGTCWLKSRKPTDASGLVAKTGVVSAELVAATAPVSPDVCASSISEPNVDFLGNDIGNVLGGGAADCCTKCSQRVGCGAYTWSNYNGGTCWLKSGKGATATKTGVVSAVLKSTSTTAPPPGTPTTTTVAPTPAPPPATTTQPPSTVSACASIEKDVDYIGNDLTNVAGSGAEDCCAKCSQRAGCGAFTWSSYAGGTCWLKSAKGATKTTLGVVSGVPKTKAATTAPPPATTTTTATTTPVPMTTTGNNPFVTSCPAYSKDVDFVGNDIGNVVGANAGDCCAKCIQRQGCGAFTWTSANGGTCYLKSARGTTADRTGVVSAVVVVSLPVPSPAPAPPPGLPAGYIFGGASKPQQHVTTSDGAVGNPLSYTSSCALPNYTSKNNKIYVTGPNGESHAMAIKGINWFGMETSATLPLGMWYGQHNGTTAYSIAAFLARNNFNSVRLPICMDSLLRNIRPDQSLVNATANRAIKTDTYINSLKSIIKALAFRQISVLIDIHTLTTKDIGALWYNDQISEAQFLQGIDMLTGNLCNNEFYNVLGVDLKNEPHGATWGDGSAKDFRAAAARIGNRMLKGCPNWLAFVEGTVDTHTFTNSAGKTYQYSDWWGGGLSKAKQQPVTLDIPNKVVYAPHYYSPAVWPIEYYYGDKFTELSDALLKENTKTTFDTMFGHLAQDPNGPAVVLGEFGGLFALDRHPKKTIQRAYLYTVELLLRPGFAGGYVWTLNPESGYDWNPFNSQGMFQEGLLLSDWRTTNEPFLAALAAMDTMADLKPLQCFALPAFAYF